MKYDRQIIEFNKNRQIRNKTEIQPLNKEENWISKSLEREGGETLETREEEEENEEEKNNTASQTKTKNESRAQNINTPLLTYSNFFFYI